MARPKAPPGSPDDTEHQFYEALQHGDIDKLMALWADDDEIVCVHPGGPRLIGPGAIRAGFEALFALGPLEARPEQVRRIVGPSSAVHSVVERVQVTTSQGQQVAWALATNVYVRTAQGWRMVVHHASPGLPHEPQEVVEPPSVLH